VLLLEPLHRLAQVVHQRRVALNRREVGRQVGHRHQRAFAQDHRALQGLVQLAPVAAPATRHPNLHRLVRPALHALAQQSRVPRPP